MKNYLISVLLFGLLTAHAQKIRVTHLSPDAVYQCGENADFSVNVEGFGENPDLFTVKISNDNGTVLNSYKYDIKSGNPFQVSAGTMDVPGFLRVTVSLGKVVDSAAAAFEPLKIKAGFPEPKDFDNFWADCVQRQKQIKDPVQFIPFPQFDNEDMKAFKVVVSTLNDETIYGYLSVPNKDGTFPVVAYVPGASQLLNQPDRNWVKKGVMFLAMNVHRIDPSNDSEVYDEQRKTIYPFRFAGLPDREKYYFRNSILAVSEAIDAMTEHPKWDGQHLAFSGASQGGAFALYMGGLNKNLTAAVATISALCDHGGFFEGGRAPGWPLLYRKAKGNSEIDMDELMTMAAYFDGANFAKRIGVPLLMTVGFKDTVCSPSSVYAAYNAATTEKEIINDVNIGHGVSGSSARRIKAWLDPKLGLD